MEKTRCFRLIAGFTDRELRISRQICLQRCQKEGLTAATFMMLSRIGGGSQTSKEL
jgi:hypothetical protein